MGFLRFTGGAEDSQATFKVNGSTDVVRPSCGRRSGTFPSCIGLRRQAVPGCSSPSSKIVPIRGPRGSKKTVDTGWHSLNSLRGWHCMVTRSLPGHAIDFHHGFREVGFKADGTSFPPLSSAFFLLRSILSKFVAAKSSMVPLASKWSCTSTGVTGLAGPGCANRRSACTVRPERLRQTVRLFWISR